MKIKFLLAAMLISFCVYGQKELKIKKEKVYDKEEVVMYCEFERPNTYTFNYTFKNLKSEVICTMQKAKYLTLNQFYVAFQSLGLSFTANYEVNEEGVISSFFNNGVIENGNVNKENLIKYAKERKIQLMTPQGPLPFDEKQEFNTGNKETDKFLNSIDDKYKKRLTDKNVTYQDLIQSADK